MDIWQWVGLALVVWLSWDLINGYTLAHRVIYREREPLLYWLFVSLWAVIALTLLANVI